MPQVDVTTLALPDATRRSLATTLTEVFVTPDTPPDFVKIVFREIRGRQFARGGDFPFWNTDTASATNRSAHARVSLAGPAIAEVTIGPLDEVDKRRIARGVSEALVGAGLAEDEVIIRFRHITGRDTAEAGGVFPFRPEGLPW
jgi:phenylpyruvate tautomerase PptA (4-oxalocrotonate tautomerase family)